jgi:hypothetical protein
LTNVTDSPAARAFNWPNGLILDPSKSLYSPGRRRPITRAMTAASELALASRDETPPEPAWGQEEFEALSEDEVLGLLLRRMRKLSERGWDPCEALVAATRIQLAIQ